jgi:SpoVK/Ycf46/Vps4 family AAA+-type ATPase
MTGVDLAYQPIVRLWTARALLRCNGISSFLGADQFDDVTVARMLGYTDASMLKYTRRWGLCSLQRKLQQLERSKPMIPHDTMIAQNIARLTQHLGLTPVEADILHFVTLQRLVSAFGDALRTVGELTRASLCRLLSECLGHPMADIQTALDDRSKLCRAALLSVDHTRIFTFANKVDMLDGFAEELALEHDDLLALFGRSIVRSPSPRLSLDSYPQLSEDIAILKSYLAATCRHGKGGVNVLVHGRPGTGKTEFVRALVSDGGAQLLEIPTEDPAGKPRVGRARLDSFRFAQCLLANGKSQVLLFDEVEDVFSDSTGRNRDEGNSSGMKGWVNQLLERNPVPTFWVTNHIAAIDPAYRRRFDYVLHIDMPPASVRRKVVDMHTDGLAISERWREGAAMHAEMAPAVVERATKVGAVVLETLPELGADHVLTRIMNNTLDCLGERRLEPVNEGPSIDYRLDLLNADCDLQGLSEGLGRMGEGRLCLYGPPGTGKSAFGRHLATALDRPLLVRRASDILSPYVGVAERNIARMFAEASAEGAVLLFDEADSLLRERQGAQRSWEVTQVNEMLTQMETYRGIFIASTNLMESMDTAAMRRFDMSVRLGYLGPDQAREMFVSLAKALSLPTDDESCSAVSRLNVLTPGDFAAVARGARLHAPQKAKDLVERLTRACATKKQGPSRRIGFID